MKKLILVVGILTQSYFGITQEIKVIREKKIEHHIYGIGGLTFDGRDLYLKPSMVPYIYRIDTSTFQIKKTLDFILPPGYEGRGYMQRSVTISHNNCRQLLVGWAGSERIYKVNKYNGKIDGSIPGPIGKIDSLYWDPYHEKEGMGNSFEQYEGIVYNKGYYWVLFRSLGTYEYLEIPDSLNGEEEYQLQKLDSRGKLIESFIIPNKKCGRPYCKELMSLTLHKGYIYLSAINGRSSKFEIWKIDPKNGEIIYKIPTKYHILGMTSYKDNLIVINARGGILLEIEIIE
tara:strand:- start:40 stop:903 length:864 start_codon:yes stop_codon:yes gene_type:complete